METTARGNTPSSAGMSNSAEGTLTKASSSAHAAVNSNAGAADEVTRKSQACDRKKRRHAYPLTARQMRTALVPPNANEFDMTAASSTPVLALPGT